MGGEKRQQGLTHGVAMNKDELLRARRGNKEQEHNHGEIKDKEARQKHFYAAADICQTLNTNNSL